MTMGDETGNPSIIADGGLDPMEGTVISPPGYVILGELGRGGMGIVYKAQDLERDRLVALKMILSGRGAVILELARFRIEAEAIASLAHPNIVLIHEVGVHLGYPFFALEFAGGGSLAQRIRGRQLPCDWTAHVTSRLALAMQHAHDRGILHRDLKPSNVLMTSGDIPKVTDFGLAKFTTAEAYRNSIESGMTITIPRAFQELTRLRRDFRRLGAASEQDVNGASSEPVRPGTTRDDQQIGEPPALAMEALQGRQETDAEDDRSPAFQDLVIRSEWRQTPALPNPEDERLFGAIRQFMQDALHQASGELPGEIQALANLTESGAIMGTPQYMAPEQAWGHTGEVGRSADIYSLGAIMYEMLTGRPPFTGDRYQVIAKARSSPPAPPREHRASIDPALEAICLKCLEKSAERRYESMGALAEDLLRFLNGVEVSALRESPTDQRWVGPTSAGEGTRTWIPGGTTEDGPEKARRWWQFWR